MRYRSAICLGENWKTTEILRQDSQFMDPDLNLGHHEYETEVLFDHFQCPKNVCRIKMQFLFKYYYSIPPSNNRLIHSLSTLLYKSHCKNDKSFHSCFLLKSCYSASLMNLTRNSQ